MIKTFNSLFVTMFGIGKLKPIPGTFGSLATVIILYFLFHKFEISSNLILLGLVVIFIIRKKRTNIFFSHRTQQSINNCM